MQFVPDEDLDRRLSDGTLARDFSVPRFHATGGQSSTRSLLTRPLRRPVRHLKTKYDLGLDHEPLHSFADLLTRYLYARIQQKEFFNVRRQIARQYRWVSILFYMKRAIRKVWPGSIPIRIVFLAGDPQDWFSLETVYRHCTADPRFQVHVVNIGFASKIHGSSKCSAYFRKKGIPYIEGVDEPVRLERLTPDIIAVSSPYDEFRPPHYRTPNLLRYAKLMYICYGPDFADQQGALAKQVYGFDTQKNAWRIFSRSQRTVGHYRKYGGVPARRIVCLGHPRIDQYYSDSAVDLLPEALTSASAGKFKIIYAPHHSLQGWSTFLRYADQIRRLLDENEDCYLVFRPHPILKLTLSASHSMSEEAFLRLFDGERCCLYDGEDYYALFRWSDLLISDASSFLVEYAPTRNPIMYLHREDGRGLDDTLREDVHGSCYVAANEADIATLFKQITNGSDPMRDVRPRFQENMDVGMFSGGSGERIARYLGDKLS